MSQKSSLLKKIIKLKYYILFQEKLKLPTDLIWRY